MRNKLKDFFLLIISLILFQWVVPAHAGVNVYDAPSRPEWIVIEAIDDCDFSHKLLIRLKDADSHKPGDWLELLMISGEWNKCLTSGI